MKIACDDECSYFLLNDGSLYGLGLSYTLSGDEYVYEFDVPTRSEFFKDFKVYDFWSIYSTGFIATDKGLWYADDQGSPFELEEFREQKIKDVFVQFNCTFIQTDQGLFSKGMNQDGELGHGNFKPINEYCKIEVLKSDEIEYFSSGYRHCIVVTSRYMILTLRFRKNILIWR